jgi:hypothetical protein
MDLSSKDSVLSREINQPASPINYILMIIENVEDSNADVKEAELFIKRLFVQGDYKHFADKLQLSRDDLKSILIEAASFLGKKNLHYSIAIVLKSVDENREVLVSSTGTGMFFIINSQLVRVLNMESPAGDTFNNPGSFEMPRLYIGKMKKNDTLLLCSESLTAVIELHLIQRIVLSSKNPEDACKKLLLSASMSERKIRFSVAIFKDAVKGRKLDFQRPLFKTISILLIPLFLILIAFLIYNLVFRNKEKPSENITVSSFESLNLPAKVKKDSDIKPLNTISQTVANEDSIKNPINIIKKSKKEIDKSSADNKKKIINVNFKVTGSVVVISNWELIKQDILFINWESGISYNENYHKYLDSQSIPPSVKITFKDHSSKFFKINR